MRLLLLHHVCGILNETIVFLTYFCSVKDFRLFKQIALPPGSRFRRHAGRESDKPPAHSQLPASASSTHSQPVLLVCGREDLIRFEIRKGLLDFVLKPQQGSSHLSWAFQVTPPDFLCPLVRPLLLHMPTPQGNGPSSLSTFPRGTSAVHGAALTTYPSHVRDRWSLPPPEPESL